jgi:hypothetical protein
MTSKSDVAEVQLRTGWSSFLAKLSMVALLFLAVSGLAVTFAPFHPAVQWSLLIHTVVGVATLLPIAWYYVAHWLDYKRYAMSHVVLLGYVGLVGLAICTLSGVVVTWQGLLGVRMSWLWRQVHLISTFVTLGTVVAHLVFSVVHMRRQRDTRPVQPFVWQTLIVTLIAVVASGAPAFLYRGESYVNEFPEDYSYVYGEDRPFAPSLARTSTDGAFDPASLAGSESCGTSGCHVQIVHEWKSSAHRWSAMDKLFQGIQSVMAEQNGPESTRYCGGCHDPISLFSGSKNIFVEDLTGLHGYNEGVSCLSCHSIQETDLQGNANYVISQPAAYLWQWKDEGAGRVVRDFLIRTYPDEHNRLSKRMYKSPKYCAACHKQFIDEEINRVGWVQLQNQYDNWAASMWNVEGDPTKTIECRECHMPLVESTDPSAGDPADYNRSPDDGRHRSHRFIASNMLMPAMLQVDGWEEQVELTERWLQGDLEIPEIRDKWAEGPIVQVALEAPETVAPGGTIPVRVVLTSSKVGHDYPTGPLDIIQSWVELTVTDDAGNVVFSSGAVDDQNFIEPGSFLFKAEPVDQSGNLIDRHNLWEMVGVRFRRALFPGYSDSVEYTVPCAPALTGPPGGASAGGSDDRERFSVPAPTRTGEYRIHASLYYRKVDQFLLNFLFGEDSGITAPRTRVSSATVAVMVEPQAEARDRGEDVGPMARSSSPPR